MKSHAPIACHSTAADREKAAIRREFRTALMSDTKWRRLFNALSDPAMGISQGVFQFFRAPQPNRMAMPPKSWLIQRWVLDSVEVGPYRYSSIIWLDIPQWQIPRGREQIPGAWKKQDIDRAFEAVQALGRLPVEKTECGLRVTGYLP